MKKTLSMLIIFGVALSVVLSLPDNSSGLPSAQQVMYNSVLHANGSDMGTLVITPREPIKIAKAITVKKPKITPVKEDEKNVVTDAVEGDTAEEVAEPTIEAVTKDAAEKEEGVAKAAAEEPAVVAEEDVCGFPDLGDAVGEYKAQLITVRKEFRYEESEEFRVKVYIKNNGNMPWFSPDSKCPGARVYLGTTRDDGRESMFLDPSIEKPDNSAISKTTVRMDVGQMRVDAGEIVSFTFWAKADEDPSVYREFFAPYIEGGDYFRDAEFKIDIYTGVTNESAPELRKKLLYVYRSMEVNDMQIDGNRSVDIDLSEQKLQLKIDDYVVREFPISSGKAGTPTPTGNFRVMLKNEVRIAHESPHYIMPKFQMFTAMGAGLHALPSLGNDGGVFWTEARNHMGRPVSHGCVRMLPEDADFAFEFTAVGDPIYIHW